LVYSRQKYELWIYSITNGFLSDLDLRDGLKVDGSDCLIDQSFELVQRGVKKIELENDDGYQ